ncbi:ubiquinone biosynthesis O-methyltransferase, mitochondrial isoform X2 [Marmota marmota marmota]|uniref:ubiquinone biosynthesis O-methyltransferase, mitochondrial isoform X2 n=1 Tax=Marmota marmota marmota TaxID=9994 RepID=UPI002092B077|nr:ubiquinone biosynthesis O-methyltransferase, mitochondrial isoform X2 [Marmota marmota marmota]
MFKRTCNTFMIKIIIEVGSRWRDWVSEPFCWGSSERGTGKEVGPFATMWGGWKLNFFGGRFLRVLGSGCRGIQAERLRLISWAENQPTWTLQIKPWIFNEYKTMWFKSCRMTFSCLNRIKNCRDNLLKTVANHQLGKPLSGMKILDVGCGGGLLAEPLGRLGASVVGIDPVDENIKTAQHHKSFDPVLDKRIEYRVCSLEEIVEEKAETFDAVIASEVIEHVNDLETFIQCCCQVLKPGGSLFITTINKTQLSYALGIVFSEQVAGIVPKGTHIWEKFVSPEMLESILESNGLSVQTVAGMLYNPFSGYWHWNKNTSLNYAAHAVRSMVQEHTVPAANAATSPGVHEELKK